MVGEGIALDSKVVVIGAGVVGAALADDLTRLGVKSVTVVDQGPLYRTGGSTSHAPGFAFQITGSAVMSALAQRTLDKLDGLELDGEWILKRVGGIELATDQAHLEYLHRRLGFAEAWGIPARMISPSECAELFPGLDVSGVLAGLHTPTDGVVKSVRAVEWQARRAIENGAVFYGHTQVTGFRVDQGRVRGVEVRPTPPVPSHPSQGTPLPEGTDFLDADVVVVCGGLWGPTLAQMVGVELPMVPIEHCSASTSVVASLAGFDAAAEVERPMVRHQKTGSYFRQYGDRYLWGTYEHRVIPVEQCDVATPEHFARTGIEPAIHPITWDDLDHGWEEMRRLLPEIDACERIEGYNGIFSFTPDGNPMIGEVEGVRGLWFGESVWLTQSAGVASVLAEWIVTGDPGIDTSSLDYRRFDQAHLTRTASIAWASENYDEVYDIAHPRRQSHALPRFSTTPFHLRQEQRGAVFGRRIGVERPLWYRTGDADAYASPSDWMTYGWSPDVDHEAQATLAAAGLFDAGNLPIFSVRGRDAADHLERLAGEPVPHERNASAAMPLRSRTGRTLSRVTVVRIAAEEFLVVGTSTADRVTLDPGTGTGGEVVVTDLTSATTAVTVAGPAAERILREITRGELPTGDATAALDIAGAPARVLRDTSFGTPAWSLITPTEHGLYLWDAVLQAGSPHGIVPAGDYARDALRIAGGVPAFGIDVGQTTRQAPADSTDADASASGPGRILVRLRLDDRQAGLVAGEPVMSDGTVSGYTTSAARSPDDGHFRALAWIDRERVALNAPVSVRFLTRIHSATIDRIIAASPSQIWLSSPAQPAMSGVVNV